MNYNDVGLKTRQFNFRQNMSSIPKFVILSKAKNLHAEDCKILRFAQNDDYGIQWLKLHIFPQIKSVWPQKIGYLQAN